jgi:hypothetical protein
LFPLRAYGILVLARISLDLLSGSSGPLLSRMRPLFISNVLMASVQASACER